MATYYVRPDGNNSNAGTGPAANQAWQTLARIVQSGTAFTSGDTVYIAPGTYRQSITTTATYTSATYFTGDPTASQFPNVTPGVVRITNFLSTDNASATNQLLWGGVTFDFINISNIYFDHTSANGGIYYTGTGNNSTIRNCVFSGNNGAGGGVGTPPVRLTSVKNVTVENCIFMRSYVATYLTTTTDTNTNVIIRNCFAVNIGGNGLWVANGIGGGVRISNNIVCDSGGTGIVISGAGNATNISYITNNIFYGCQNGGSISGGSATNIVEDYNRRVNSGGNSTVPVGANTITDGSPQFDFGHTALFNIALQKPFSIFTGSVNSGAGLATYASTSDLYGQTWSGGAGVPDIGCATAVQASGTSYYYPTDRNASTITIAPGSTSQSIELYLGATGLTASTSGLTARYNRTRTASVSIPLVARTIAQAWTSGGFAEVDATNMPGVYRLDLPDAALAAGADDVTVVVRGASGTNGAVMTVKLSSGGLTSAQTASAVWGASPAGYNDGTTFGGVVNQIDQTVTGTSTLVQDVPYHVWEELTAGHDTHGSFGWNVLRADAPSKEGLVTLHQSGGISRIDADVHAIVNDTAAAAELKGALLHTGGDYITADLLNPVASAQTLRIGPFGVRADGGGADDALDLNQSTAANIVVQMTDGQGTGIDQTSATVQAKVYNVAGALIATYTCTAAYALGGYMSIPMTTTVTGTAGSYIINLWSTVGSTVTVYGPLQLRVRAI